MEFHKFVRNKNSKPLKTPAKPVKTVVEGELEKGLNSEVAKFADGTVLFRVIKIIADWKFARDPYDAKGVIKQQMKLNV